VAYFAVTDPNCAQVRGTGHLAQSCGVVEFNLKRFSTLARVAGVEQFQFVLTKNALVPSGTAEDTKRPFEECWKEKGKNGSSDGLNCTAWVIFNENMDYLHCDDLSWGGKTKCD
jgi:hypothetical protein